MGYCGLESWLSSDCTADFISDLFDDKFIKKLNKHLNEETNEYNTNGLVDIGLFLEIFDCKNNIPVELQDFIRDKFIPKMKKYLKEAEKIKCDDYGNKDMHINAYKRILKHAKKLAPPEQW